MSVEVTTKRRRVLGSLVAAGTVGVMAAPAQAAQAGGPADYAAQAGKAADYINGHSADVPSEHLGAQLDEALALVASGKTDAATQATLGKIKGNIQAKRSAYCAPVGKPVNVGGCAKVTITLLAAGEPTTYGGFDYAKPVTSASQFTEYATNQALDMIALERLGKPIPKALFKSVTDYASSTPKWADPDTDGLMLTALSHVKGSDTDKAKAVTSLEGRLDAAKQGEAWGFKGAGPNVNTTAWVASGLYRAGDADHKGQAVKGQAWLVSRQQADGSFGNNAAKTPEGKMMSTTQVVPALRSLQSYDNVGAHDAQSVPVNDKVQDAAVN
ncbi:prenyltransferase/squalene oxidase repeat-containing protein [Cutibacterium namnetense]|uniref:hypothetical protein n=1 Tax=Cutibacterium namnetense TaxID=1574624 RepID=UPI0018F771FD|nr:hypothetical protein [Cutibacterium namnetense]